MLERGRGKVIFTASLLTFQGGIRVPVYAAGKGGIGSLVKAFSNEWAGRGVQVNGLAPGYIATDNTQALQDDHARSLEILSRIPAGRWEHRRTWPVRRSFSPRQHPTTSPGRSWSRTVVGWGADLR
jgi:NAD(P)-dependent dehydrogenase (short-subunit alcohol dehydrogenase family)